VGIVVLLNGSSHPNLHTVGIMKNWFTIHFKSLKANKNSNSHRISSVGGDRNICVNIISQRTALKLGRQRGGDIVNPYAKFKYLHYVQIVMKVILNLSTTD